MLVAPHGMSPRESTIASISPCALPPCVSTHTCTVIDLEYVFAREFTGLEDLSMREPTLLYVCLCGEGGCVDTHSAPVHM